MYWFYYILLHLAVVLIVFAVRKWYAASGYADQSGVDRFKVPGTSPTGIASFLYRLKYVLMLCLLTLKQKKYLSRKRKSNQKYWSLLLPSDEEKQKECPQNLVAMKDPSLANDAIAFQGCDSAGNHVLIRFGRRVGGLTELWLILRLKNADGSYTKYTHPEHPATTLWGSKKMEYAVGGLRCEVAESMRRWKLNYNGWMRKSNTDSLVHVKFSFVWTALSDEFDFNEQLSPSLTAHSLAREHWCRAFFKQLTETHEDRYEQWGQMTGIVIVENELEQQLVLRGMRDHCYGLRDWKRYGRYSANMGYTTDGTFFHVGAVCIPGGTTHLLYGYVGLPTAELHAIDQCSIDLSILGEHTNSSACHVPPETFGFQFIAGGKSYMVQAQVHTETVVYNGKDWPSKSHLRFYTFSLNGSSEGEGFSEFEYRHYPGRPASSPVPELPTVFENPGQNLTREHLQYPAILPLSHHLASLEEVSGGKGRQLAQLSQIQENFAVPSGLVVTSKAYSSFLADNENIRKQIDILDDFSGSAEESMQLCSSIQKAFEAVDLPKDMADTLEDYMERFLEFSLSGQKVAVRSSAIGEDSCDSSAAGQMETYLNVASPQEVLLAIKKCWASQFSSRAVQYRRQTGQGNQRGCAVVIQQMVPAVASGVLFTMDPVSGHPGRILINANYGLGETVVSGASDPDVITLSRSYSGENLSIVGKRLGQKKIAMNIDDDVVKEVTADMSTVCCLSDSELLQVARVGIQIEKAFGGPRDIEFAFADSRLYILQARPITTDNLESDSILMHEFDSAVLSDSQYSTTANVGEVMGGANHPLGISIAMNAVDKALQYQMLLNGIQNNMHGSFQNCYTIFQNHALLNLSQTLYKDPAVISARYVSEMCVLGHPIEDSNLSEMLSNFLENYSKTKRMLNFAKVMKMMYSAYDLTSQAEREVDAFKLPGFYTKPEDIYHTLNAALEQYCKVWRCHVASSGYSGFWYHLLVAILAKGKHDWSAENYADIGLLYSSCSDVISADVPAALQELAKDIEESSLDKEEFCNASSEDGLASLLSLPQKDPARKGFSRFLDVHGHRCINEIDFYEMSWSENPEQLVTILQTIAAAKKHEFRRPNKAVPVDESIEKLHTSLNVVQRKILQWAVPKARRAVSNREHTKSMAIKVGHSLRLEYRKLSKVLASKKLLPDADLMYYLTHCEIGTLIEGHDTRRLIYLATRRRRLHEKLEKTSLPDIVIGYPKDIGHNSTQLGSQLSGTPVSSGIVEGRIRVARNLQDARLLQKGEILVTHSTDIAWSVFFPVISGVVTELGGLLSHGAVVAREYGLPCIVSVKKATEFFQTGDNVILDGANGTISKINEVS